MLKINAYVKYKLLDYINQSTNYTKVKFVFYLLVLFLLSTLISSAAFFLFGQRSIVLLFLFVFIIIFSDLYKSLMRLFYSNDHKFLQLLGYNKIQFILAKEISRKIILIGLGVWINVVIAICSIIHGHLAQGIIYILLTGISGLFSFLLRVKLIELYIYKIRFLTPRFMLLSNIGLIIPIFMIPIMYLYFKVWDDHVFINSIYLYIVVYTILFIMGYIINSFVIHNKEEFKNVGISEFYNQAFENQLTVNQNTSTLHQSLLKQELYIIRKNPPVKVHLFFIVNVAPLVIFYSVLFYLNQHNQSFYSFIGLLFLLYSPFIFFQQTALSYYSIDIDGEVMTKFGYIHHFIKWKVFFRMLTSISLNALLSLIIIGSLFLIADISLLYKMLMAAFLTLYIIGIAPVGVFCSAMFPNYKWEQVTDIPTTIASITYIIAISVLSLIHVALLWLSIHVSLLYTLWAMLISLISFSSFLYLAYVFAKKRLFHSRASFKIFLE